MKQIGLKNTGIWAKEDGSRWKKYVYALIAAEISTTTEFCDECIQIAPKQHDTGLLFEGMYRKVCKWLKLGTGLQSEWQAG